ncbi:MAG: hypothetical protein IJX15_07625 [Ruminiclostridium sp.]|nr:hypothetical protein [Ruminiclostridium sp.]MBQ8842353.1 hypothetical protein [Ruminiclostridium sp.]
MNIRELLNSHSEINNAINSKLEQIAELKALATKVTASTFSESHSKGTYNDRTGRTTARIIDLENEINEEIDRLVEIKVKIRGLVASLTDPNLRIVLERRYILGENWEKIAEKMGYSPRHILRMHNHAVEILENGNAKEIA